MARRGNDSVGEDKAKVRVLFAEVDGNNESVQEALRTMVSAMGRPARVLQVRASGELPAPMQHNLEVEPIDDVLNGESFEEESPRSETNGGRQPRGSGQKTDRNAGIALVPDLDFRPNGHPTLREFFSAKAPRTDLEEALVVLHYMQNMMGISKIGLGHIRTALKDVGKSIPLDLRQTIRNMRNKKAWVKYSDLNEITTATAGDNHVLHDMGEKG